MTRDISKQPGVGKSMAEDVDHSLPLLKVERACLSLALLKSCILGVGEGMHVRKCWVSQFSHAVF